MAEEKKSSYKTMVVGIGGARKELHTGLTALAEKLNCKISDLVWAAVKTLLAEPPETAPEGASVQTGTSPGFWVVPVTNDKGKATAIKVVEVEKRAEMTGRTFFRFKDGDVKARARARGQAVRAAQYDVKMLGFKDDSLIVEEFED